MQIEIGKSYKSAGGAKVKVMFSGPRSFYASNGGHYAPDGTLLYSVPESDRVAHRLIAEWTEGPVRTVTRREIVPGVYGRVCLIGKYTGDSVHVEIGTGCNAAELRAAAATFLELAEALEDVG